MPRISDRMVPDVNKLDYVTPISTAANVPISGNPSVLQTPLINSFMSSGGNSVPMRGILPIEQMTDSDINRFFPYSAYMDRIPKYTYFAALNSGK